MLRKSIDGHEKLSTGNCLCIQHTISKKDMINTRTLHHETQKDYKFWLFI